MDHVMNLSFLRRSPEYNPYVRMQDLLGGLMSVLACAFSVTGKNVWSSGHPFDGWALLLFHYFLFGMPLLAASCIAGFIVSRLRLRRNVAGISLSVVITIAIYFVGLPLFLFTPSNWEEFIKLWEVLWVWRDFAPYPIFSALILSIFLPKAPPAKEDE